MPHKFNADRRDKIPKQKHRVTNWPEYNEALRRRGDLTVWVSDEAIESWVAPRRYTRGGQAKYSDLAIETCLTLGMVFRQALRQTQGLMGSISKLLGVEISVPHFSTLSRRGDGLNLSKKLSSNTCAPIHLAVDSTGLKIYDAGEWLEEKHKIKRKRRSWRKLHLGLDLNSGEIVCADLTSEDVGDPSALPDLLEQISAPVHHFLADGAYDGNDSRELLVARFGEGVKVAIPPPKTAILSADTAQNPTSRDRDITIISTQGRMVWQASSGYNSRARIETQMGRWKAVIGAILKARRFENQKTEAQIGARILNKMTALGRPIFERTA